MNEDRQPNYCSWSGVIYVLNPAASLGSPDDVPKAHVWMQTSAFGGSSAFEKFDSLGVS